MSQSQKAVFVHGDQFVGMNVNPNNGELILRYWFFEGDRQDANGRGVTDYSIEENYKASIGRPIIYAPNEMQGGTRGHTSFLSKNAYDYEIGRILTIERATKNIIDRIKKGLIQSSSSYGFDYNLYNKLLEKEKKVWVTDVMITNPTAKKILLNPATTHLIPRYISPSIIHKRNTTGDYSKVDKWVLDHIGIVDKPVFANGKQIAGAAYGEDARLRGACFGNPVECLNILQTSSSTLSTNLEKVVSCPTELNNRLSKLYYNTMKNHSYLLQSSSSNNVSTDNNNQQTNTPKPANPLGNLLGQQQPTTPTIITTPDNQQTFVTNPTNNQFVPDDKQLSNYQQFGEVVKQWMIENKNEVRTLLDSEKPLPNPEGQQPPITPTATIPTTPTTPTPDQESQTQIDTKALLDKLNITTEQLKTMETKDIAAKLTEVKGVLETVLRDSARTTKALNDIRTKEEIEAIEAIIPKDAYTDSRGFNKKDYDELVGYLHDVKDKKGQALSKDILTIIGVGIITIKKEQMETSQKQKDLKTKASEFFGSTIKNIPTPPTPIPQAQ